MFIVACICNEKNSFVVQCVLFLKESAYIRKFCICMGTEPECVETGTIQLMKYSVDNSILLQKSFKTVFIKHFVLLKTTGFVNTLQSVLETNCHVHIRV